MISRRGLLLGGLSLAAVAGCAASPQAPRSSDPAEPLPPVGDRIDALRRRHNAEIGLYATDLESGREIAVRDGDSYALCSTFKAYASAAILQRAQQGRLGLTGTVRVDRADIQPHSPVTELRVGTTMTLAELCQAALQQSDNAAGNLLLRTLGGPPAITEFARGAGDDRSRLDRWETALNSAVPGDPRDTGTPRALGTGFRAVLTGDVLDPAHRQQLEDWMRANETSSMRAGLPAGWSTADKTGSGGYGTTNDVGIAYGPQGQRWLLSIMTRAAGDDADAPNLRPLIGEIASVVVAELHQPQ
ncbi:class A beta-lactamase [Mycolicibacterium psychrotolerans]|uniref:Beta-lactamase n=1 Tax=Mycolicibacterium psychrotolerans TaxID=216929 RepID=A0A7I7MGG9_9MYCO|nr:class A beta-lactamase [Mycolicibacterium psychrotolerans]BBX70880.1 beta-lactamase [Mycolicibacterium psychrotolerans]